MNFLQFRFPRSLFIKHLRLHTMNLGCNENNWRGVPLTEIYGSQSPWGAPEFPLVTPSHNHTVLYHVPNSGNLVGDRPPKPQIGRDKWDHDHVRMPCSSQSLYPVEENNGKTNLKKRWEIIENALRKPIRNSHDLANAILSYNTKFKNIWKFQALHQLFNEELEEEESQYFFDVTLPETVKLALSLPKLIQSPIPLLKQQTSYSVSMSQQQIACLLANAFFCTFPRRNTTKKKSEFATYPFINFNSLYEHRHSDTTMEKLKSICHYFKRVCTKVPVGVVTFARRSVSARARPDWSSMETPFASVPLHVDSDNTIEDAHGLIQLDFANKYLGGGVLGYGCVQEEIRFIICPELMISMLFTEMMKPNEAVMVIGCERYSKYAGYGGSFQWAGDYQDKTPYDSSGRRRCAVLAVDALPCASPGVEYARLTIDRELNKAWIGFSFFTDTQTEGLQYPGLATGNWGCGAFGGCPRLKSLIQLMASARARRPVAYYTFKDVELRDDIINVCNLLARHNVTVGQLYKYIVRFSQTDVTKSDLHKYLCQELRGEASDKTSSVHVQDEMEASIKSETSLNELSSSLQMEFSRELENSPELFSQDDTDVSLIEVKVEPSRETTQEHKPVLDRSTKTTLIEAMQKIDNENAEPVMMQQSTNRVGIASCDRNVTPDKNQRDPTVELKKKISRKITDYFGKKTI